MQNPSLITSTSFFTVDDTCPYQRTDSAYPTYLDVTVENVVSELQCQRECTNYRSFNCRSLAFRPTGSQCFLSGDDTSKFVCNSFFMIWCIYAFIYLLIFKYLNKLSKWIDYFIHLFIYLFLMGTEWFRSILFVDFVSAVACVCVCVCLIAYVWECICMSVRV